MADKEIQNGQAEYGVIHVQEEQMREAGLGVFEESSGEAGRKRRAKKAPVHANKMVVEPANKAASKKDAK